MSSETIIRRICLLLAVTIVAAGKYFTSVTSLHAENITWTGTSQLVSNPFPPFAYLYPDAFMPSSSYAGNTVTIKSGPSLGNTFVYGGYSTATGAQVQNNTVIMTAGTVEGMVLGGMVAGTAGTYYMGLGNALDNTVRIGGDAFVEEVFGGFVFGTGNAIGNRVYVEGNAVVEGAVTGGSGMTGGARNAVFISGGTVGSAVMGGIGIYGNAVNNIVWISGGVVGGEEESAIAGGRTTQGDATGNSVHISGGSIMSPVIGGAIYDQSGSGIPGNADGNATNNTVMISGSPVFTDGGTPVDLYGGYQNGVSSFVGDLYSGNTLYVWNYTGSAVGNISNFQNYDFVIPSSFADGDILVSAESIALDADALSGTAAEGKRSLVTGISIVGGDNALQAGDSVVLLSAEEGITGSPGNLNSIVQGVKGISLLYDFQLGLDGNALTATAVGVEGHPRARALSEGRLAGLAFVSHGADLIAGSGVDEIRNSGSGLGVFFAGQGASFRYDTGSHVDVDGYSLMTGMAWNAQTDSGKWVFGAFFEAGRGGYDSYNTFDLYDSVAGDGDAEYYGGGVLGRFDFKPAGVGNIYAEASFRAGWLETDFSSSDLRDVLGNKAEYDSGAAYYGAHLGFGYLCNINGHAALDLSSRYFWTHLKSDAVSVAGDPVEFESVDSHRWRGGATLSRTITTERGLVFIPSIGVAYEHEFDGEAKSSAYGYSLDAPDLGGGTGIGELGLSFRPSETSSLSLVLAVQGYSGVRDGVAGSIRLQWGL